MRQQRDDHVRGASGTGVAAHVGPQIPLDEAFTVDDDTSRARKSRVGDPEFPWMFGTGRIFLYFETVFAQFRRNYSRQFAHGGYLYSVNLEPRYELIATAVTGTGTPGPVSSATETMTPSRLTGFL